MKGCLTPSAGSGARSSIYRGGTDESPHAGSVGFGRTFVRLSLGLVAAALVMLAVFAAVCPHAAIAAPAGWQISQLTTSTGSHHPDTDGKWLVWLSGSEVMARDLSTGEVHQLSNDGTSKSDPLVNDDTVIWSATTSGALHGYLYHLSSGPLQDLGVIPDTPVSYDAGRFAYRKQVSGQLMHAVYVYDLTTRLSTLITNSGDDPSLRGSYLAYANEDSTGWSLRLLDLTTAQGVKISTNQTPVSRVNLSDSYVVWALDSSDTMEIYLLDRATN